MRPAFRLAAAAFVLATMGLMSVGYWTTPSSAVETTIYEPKNAVPITMYPLGGGECACLEYDLNKKHFVGYIPN